MKRVHCATPWTCEALNAFEHDYPEAAAALDAAVPAGHDVILTTTGRPHSFGAILRNENGLVARDQSGHPTVAAACYAVLRG